MEIPGETIQTTPEHPFYVRGKGWMEAGMLLPGDELVLQNGKLAHVKSVWCEELVSPVTVYNFEVEDFHTYFVGENRVLVHNVCKGNWGKGTYDSPEDCAEDHYIRHKNQVGAKSLEDFTRKATGFANNYLKGKRTLVPGKTPNLYRYGTALKYVDLVWNEELQEHLLISFGGRFPKGR